MNWLLLRGLARQRAHWHGFDRRLAEHAAGTVVCLDLPGFGDAKSRWPKWTIGGIAEDVRRRWRPGEAVGPWGVVGVSLGAMVALGWSQRRRDDFTHRVLISTSTRGCGTMSDRIAPSYLARTLWGWLRGARVREREILRKTTNLLHGDRFEATLQRNVEVAASRATFASGLPQLVAGGLYGGGDLRPTIPTLVLAGAKDELVAPACSERLARRIGGDLRIHPHAGHDLPLDDPDWVLQQIVDWAEGGGRAAVS